MQISYQIFYKIDLKLIDIGGGLGIPYYNNESEIAVDHLIKTMPAIINRYTNKKSNTEIIMESGRFLVGKSGIFVSQIVDIKKSKNIEFIVIDGGTNCAIGIVIGFGMSIGTLLTLILLPVIYTLFAKDSESFKRIL